MQYIVIIVPIMFPVGPFDSREKAQEWADSAMPTKETKVAALCPPC